MKLCGIIFLMLSDLELDEIEETKSLVQLKK